MPRDVPPATPLMRACAVATAEDIAPCVRFAFNSTKMSRSIMGAVRALRIPPQDEEDFGRDVFSALWRAYWRMADATCHRPLTVKNDPTDYLIKVGLNYVATRVRARTRQLRRGAKNHLVDRDHEQDVDAIAVDIDEDYGRQAREWEGRLSPSLRRVWQWAVEGGERPYSARHCGRLWRKLRKGHLAATGCPLGPPRVGSS